MKTLFILHGWQSSGAKWQKVRAIIERHGIRVFAPDIPGFKPETELKEPWNLDNYIDWFYDYVRQAELEYPQIADDGFYLLGHSFGGQLAIKIAYKKIFKLNGVILVSAAALRGRNKFNKEAFGLGAKLVKAFRLRDTPFIKNVYNFLRIFFYRYIIQKTDYLDAKGALNETIRNVLAEDLREKLHEILEPTKIIWGSNDKYTPIKDAYIINEKIKNSELDILEKIGHMPYLDCPEKLANSIIKFIQK